MSIYTELNLLGVHEFTIIIFVDILQTTQRMLSCYGSPFRVWIGTRFLVGVADPDDFKIILNNPNCLAKEELYRFLAYFTGQSLFSATDGWSFLKIPRRYLFFSGVVSRWRHHRKLISPAFNLRVLKTFVPVFEEQSLLLCEKLKAKMGGGFFDVYPFVSRCILDIVCGKGALQVYKVKPFQLLLLAETVLGVKVGAQLEESEYMHWIDR